MNCLAVFVELEHEIDAHRSDTSAIFDVYNFFFIMPFWMIILVIL